MNFPEELKYDKSHEWVRSEGKIGTIGITDFAQSELGDIVFLDITKSVGDQVEVGEIFGTIEAVKTVSDLYSPVSGKIVEINNDVNDTPDSINKDPYNSGWMVKVEITSGLDSLMDSTTYKSLIGM
ncbi:MAG: glycine cleavage system protein GcvH [Chlorobiota bacterium]|jgi:glycine cleavage system H protein|nr:glycine cleavage system protein GcvH [Chlorobiota bacterium]QQS66229.1 MAG: glycine cleavage system protein GcvH [Chlorobiota bacterium]